MNETIVCSLCNKEFKLTTIAYHLRYAHKEINQKEYYDKYIDSSNHLCTCGKPLKFIRISEGYNKTCGKYECIYKQKKIDYGYGNPWENPESIEKAKNTRKLKWDDEYYNNRPKMKQTKLERYNDSGYHNIEQMKQTNLERYGVEYSIQTEESIEKRKKTKKERYNDEYFTNFQKIEQTFLEKYNVPNVGKLYSCKGKIKETKLERYNNSNYNNSKKMKQTKLERYDNENYNNMEKHRQTNLKRYGVEYAIQLPKFKQKSKNTKFIKYGDENYSGNFGWGNAGKKSQKLFFILEKKLQENNILCEKINYGYKKIKKEKRERKINVRNISEIYKVRFLDCYIEINGRQINFEFDEKGHKNSIEADLIREIEILTVKPFLEIYRIKEKYYDENFYQVIEDLIEIIKNKDAKTFYDYNNLIENF